jgi:DNA-binding NarL/FixJ family response regulator
MTMQEKAIIVDDHPLTRKGLRGLLERKGMTCSEAGDVDSALALLAHEGADLLLVDVSLPGRSGLDLIHEARALYPDLKILVVSMLDEKLYAPRALHAGADGFVSKDRALEEVIEAVRGVLAGEVYLSPRMRDRLLREAATGVEDLALPAEARLSDRELEVFELIGRGTSTQAIARQLHLSAKTVETHRERIKEKLGLESSLDLVRRAVRWVDEEKDPDTSSLGDK